MVPSKALPKKFVSTGTIVKDKNQNLKPDDYFVYVGTYTDGGSEGIYICRLDTSTGELRQIGIARNVCNPSYLVIDGERHRLYAVNEVSNFDGRPGGAVSAFAIQPSSGELLLINQISSHGGAPCYLSLDLSGRYLLVANYTGGNTAVIPVGEDGVLGEPTDTIAHSGSSLHPQRQAGPHPHSIVLDPAGQHVFVPDLGLDKVMQYRFDRKNGRLYANQRPWVGVKAGSGPRHIVFHPNGGTAYVINELSSTITAYEYDSTKGTLKHRQTVTTLPEGYSGTNIAADLHLTPNGKLLLGSNRGHDSIALYAVNQEDGWLTWIDCISTRGRTPRGFTIDPSGTFVLVANQDSHTMAIFRIDEDHGTIFATGHEAHVPNPVCVKLFH